jgi:diadenosine tetraphosphate (Ap4A) HIT family hydrolase
MNQLKTGCLPCDIVAGRVSQPGGTIYEDEFWNVGSTMGPVVWRGFLIIKLKRHCEHVAELTPPEAAALGMVIQASSLALMEVLKPAKIFVCSFGDMVRHIHFWLLPRPPEMRAGMHAVMMNLDVRTTLTRHLGVKRWIVPESEIEQMAARLRDRLPAILA